MNGNKDSACVRAAWKPVLWTMNKKRSVMKKCLFRKDAVKGAYNIRKTGEKKGQNLNDQMRRHEHFWATIDPS
jgi:hypothetical protein